MVKFLLILYFFTCRVGVLTERRGGASSLVVDRLSGREVRSRIDLFYAALETFELAFQFCDLLGLLFLLTEFGFKLSDPPIFLVNRDWVWIGLLLLFFSHILILLLRTAQQDFFLALECKLSIPGLLQL